MNNIKLITSILLLSILSACNTSDKENENTAILSWEQITDLPQEYARIGSFAIVNDGVAYLMPGKGNGRYSYVPEIITFSDESGWNKAGTYQGIADAGGSAYWQYENKIIVVGGNNNIGAPFSQVATTSLDGNGFSILNTVFPKGPITTKSYSQLNNKGYIGYSTSEFSENPSQNGIASFDFETKEWADISLPVELSNLVSKTLMVATETSLFLYDQENSTNNFFKYLEQADSWIQLAGFPGITRRNATIVASDDAIYVGFGNDSLNVYKDIWKYDIEKNEWESFIEFPGTAFHSGIGFYNEGELFFGAGNTTIIIGENGMPLNTAMYAIKIN